MTAQGRLLLQNDLLVAEVAASKTLLKTEKVQFQSRRTFLFEQIIIFSEQPDKKKNPLLRPSYLYRNSVRVSFESMYARGQHVSKTPPPPGEQNVDDY